VGQVRRDGNGDLHVFLYRDLHIGIVQVNQFNCMHVFRGMESTSSIFVSTCKRSLSKYGSFFAGFHCCDCFFGAAAAPSLHVWVRNRLTDSLRLLHVKFVATERRLVLVNQSDRSQNISLSKSANCIANVQKILFRNKPDNLK
jgi:hypothetical protein